MYYGEFCVIFKSDYLVEHLRTAASDILRYLYKGVSPARSSILALIHFKLILESYTSAVYLEPYQKSRMKRFGKKDMISKALKNFL